MSRRCYWLCPAVVVIGLVAGGCEWPWPYDDPEDPFRCDPPCDTKLEQTCRDGKCVKQALCNNGKVDDGEQCDGQDLDQDTCQDLGFTGGTLACTSDCRHDTSGCTFVTSLGGTGDDVAVSLGLDSSGNHYVSGNFLATVKCGSWSATAGKQPQALVAGLDRSGKCKWVVGSSSTGMTLVRGLVSDGGGNSFITGAYDKKLTLGSSHLPSIGGGDGFIARLDPKGTVDWAMSLGGKDGGDGGAAIALDGQGNIYVAGAFSGTVSFDSIQRTAQGTPDLFVAKLSSDGAYQWVARAGGKSASLSCLDIAVDARGRSTVTGARPLLGGRRGQPGASRTSSSPRWTPSESGPGAFTPAAVMTSIRPVSSAGASPWTGRATPT